MQYFDIIIVGAGFSGSSIAAQLKKESGNSLSIAVVERGLIAAGASGNSRAHMIPYITAPEYPGHAFYNAGFSLTAKVLNELATQHPAISIQKTPALQFPTNDRPQRMLDRIAKGQKHSDIKLISVEEAQEFTKFRPSHSPLGLYPESFTVDPAELCRAWILQSGASVRTNEEVLGIKKIDDATFLVTTNKDQIQANVVILTNAHEATRFFPERKLFLKPVRGQLFSLPTRKILHSITIPLCFNGYFLPGTSRYPCIVGASYDHTFLSPLPCPERNEKLLTNLNAIVDGEIDMANLELEEMLANTRVSFRAITKDRLPLAGEIEKNVYISAGHGSRGLHSCPLSAQLISNLILNKATEVNQFQKLLSPLRHT